jgi:NTP pyrophosphatase (non-canonical NTP hydrolase)
MSRKQIQEVTSHRGLIDKAIERGVELRSSVGQLLEGLLGELGDVLWYITEVARFEGIDLAEFNGSLWYGSEPSIKSRDNVKRTIKDLFTFVPTMADYNGLWLSDVFGQAINKLATRPREPHVLADAEALDDIATSKDVERREVIAVALQHVALLAIL